MSPAAKLQQRGPAPEAGPCLQRHPAGQHRPAPETCLVSTGGPPRPQGRAAASPDWPASSCPNQVPPYPTEINPPQETPAP